MFRPLLTALVEYTFAYYAIKRGKQYARVIAATLFFLASYQMGEFIVFATDSKLGIQFAYFSTTLLPPLGLLLIKQITKKENGYIFFQLTGLAMALNFLLRPAAISHFETEGLFVRVEGFNTFLGGWWSEYYVFSLVYACVLMAGYITFTKSRKIKQQLIQTLIAYISFFGVSIAYLAIVPDHLSKIASIMCSLASFAAIILTRIAVKEFDEEDQEIAQLNI